MPHNTVYTKTAKGVLEVKNKTVRLPRELGLLFLAIDGKSTVADLARKTGGDEGKLREALAKMAADGYIKAIESYSAMSAAAKPAADTEELDLDFTSPATVAKLNAEAETRVKAEAEAKARAHQAARAAAEAKVRQETEARARAMAEAKMKAEAQAKAKAEAEAKAANDARAKAEQEASVAANAQAKAAAEARVRAAVEAKAKAEAEARLRAAGEALAKQEAEAKTVGEARAREEAEARARAEAEARAHAEAETRARATLEAQIKAMGEALAQAEARAKQEAEARVKMEGEIKARAEAEARARAEAEARAAAAEAAVTQAQAMAGAAAKAKAEADARVRQSAQGTGDPKLMLRMEEAMKALEEAKTKAREDAKARETAEARAREEAAARKREEAESKTRAEAEHRKSEEAEARAKAQIRELREQARLAREAAEANAGAERKAREQAEANADAERKAREQAEANADAERKSRDEAIRKARAEVEAMIAAERASREAAEQKSKQALSAKIMAERKAREEAERQTEIAHKARAEAEKKAREATGSDSVAANKARAEAEAAAKAAETALAKAVATAHAERKARAEAEERAKAETVARIIQEKQLREKADGEVKQRVTAELKARELAEREADARYRAEAGERARAAAEKQKTQFEQEARSAAQSPQPRKSPHRAKNAAIGTVVLLAAAAGLLQFVPLTGQIAGVQQIMAQRLQQPVAISDMRYALFPTPHLTLEQVAIGKLQEIKINSIVAEVWPFALLAEQKDIDSVEVNSVAMDQDVLAMFPGWVKPATGAPSLHVGRISITAVRMTAKSMEVPVFNATITLERNGTLKKALLTDGKLRIDLAPSDQVWRVNATASNWRPPFGPPIDFDDLTLTAFIDGQKAAIKGIEGRIGRGTFTGSANASWGADIRMTGDVSLSNADLGKLLGAFTRDFSAAGTLNLTATYALQAASLAALFDQPRVEASFSAEKGTLNNVDIVRGIQSPSRDGTRGGKTSFSALAGSLQVLGKEYAYRQLQLTSGPMNAAGTVDVAPDGELSGRITAELGTKSVIVARGGLNVSGNVKSPLLKP